jgi:hypothetical protein
MLLELLDGGITNIISDTWHWDGCETCDYGSKYVNEFEIQLTTRTIRIEASRMYDYILSEGYMMELFLPNVDNIKNMTEDTFEQWIKEQIDKLLEEEDFEVNICGLVASVTVEKYNK